MKTAIVTGGGGALGTAICLELASLGWRLAIFDRVEAFAQETIDALNGHPASTHILDVADRDATAKAVAEVFAANGAIDALVNAAGGAFALGVPPSDFIKSNPDHWNRFIDVNLYATFSLCHLVAPYMKQAKSGGIVSIASGAGMRGGPPKSRQAGAAVYSASKAAVIAFTQALAQELGPFGIRVNAVAPGRNESRDKPFAKMLEMLKQEEQAEAGSGRLSPLGRYGRPADIGKAVGFLLSDKADYITGCCLDLTGGIRLH